MLEVVEAHFSHVTASALDFSAINHLVITNSNTFIHPKILLAKSLITFFKEIDMSKYAFLTGPLRTFLGMGNGDGSSPGSTIVPHEDERFTGQILRTDPKPSAAEFVFYQRNGWGNETTYVRQTFLLTATELEVRITELQDPRRSHHKSYRVNALAQFSAALAALKA